MKYFLLIALLACFACTCHDVDFPLEEADFLEPLTVSGGNQDNGFFYFSFNKNVDLKSLVPGKSIYVVDGAVNYTGEFFMYPEDPRLLLIPACAFWPKNGAPEPFKFKLAFNGERLSSAIIRGVDGSILDGDEDNFAGGNEVFELSINRVAFKCPNPSVAPQAEADTLRIVFNSRSETRYLYLSVSFDMPVDTASMQYGNTYWVNASLPDGRSISTLPVLAKRWVSSIPYRTQQRLQVKLDIKNVSSDAIFMVKLKGVGKKVVKSCYGVTLDGDQDDRPGGDYITSSR
jgi:hypothetical protein